MVSKRSNISMGKSLSISANTRGGVTANKAASHATTLVDHQPDNSNEEYNEDGDYENNELRGLGNTNDPKSLLFYNQLEPWRKDNKFLKSGYARVSGLLKGCLNTLLFVHNETGNIYTHLVPGLFVFALIYVYLQNGLPMYETHLGWEVFNFYQFAFGATFCLGASATFHTIKTHSLPIFIQGNLVDYIGIVVLITTSLISIVLFAFYDHPNWKYTFIVTFLILGLMCSYVTLNPLFRTPDYRSVRSLMFSLFGLSGLFPVIVATVLYGPKEASERASGKWLALEGVFYLGGASIYAMRIPERWSPPHLKVGWFDYWGHSHQIFHVLVVVAAFCHWKALVGCYKYLHEVILLEHLA